MNKDKLAAEVTQELDQSPAPSSGDDRHPARGVVALAPTNDTAMSILRFALSADRNRVREDI
jgi:hypothetical protein